VGEDPKSVWAELAAAGHRPWIQRKLENAARLPLDVNLAHLDCHKKGRLEIQDLASQAVCALANPDPGERWWLAGASDGQKALYLASSMKNKGVVNVSDQSKHTLLSISKRARAYPFCNISPKLWDGKHVAGKAGRYDGVIVEPLSSGIGTWRRKPWSRWEFDPQTIALVLDGQKRALETAAMAVKAGGSILFTVATVNPRETTGLIASFLESHPQISREAFLNPLHPEVEAKQGELLITPSETDGDAVFVARMVRKS
jgi:16S rRNA (cytosine967-C5)-methyltransferase